MLNRVLFFHKCKAMITAILISSGKPFGACEKEISFRQYTTSMPMMVKGRTSAKYVMYLGISFFSGKSRKGSVLVKMVPSITIVKNIINCVVVKFNSSSSPLLLVFLIL